MVEISSINALLEALRSKMALNKVFISNSRKDAKIHTLKKLCKENGVAYQLVPQQVLQRKAGPQNQGVFAELSPVRFHTLNEILGNLKTGVLIVLEGIHDVGNLGAIIRTATAANVDGILISQRNSAPINETVLKTSAGSLFYARIVKSKNLDNDIKKLKENGFWIVGTDMKTGQEYYNFEFPQKCVLIFGNEAKGISPLMKKRADQFVFIPHEKEVESLNVSVSAAIILFEARRQRGSSGTFQA